MAIEDKFAELRLAIEAGFYTEDSDTDQDGNPVELTAIPWAGKRCEDCPFFTASSLGYAPGKCKVRGNTDRQRKDHTCRFFDPQCHAEAEKLIATHNDGALREWSRTQEALWWS